MSIRIFSLILLAGTVLASPAMAQERSSVGAGDMQSSVGALKAIMQQTEVNTQAVDSRINQIVKCNNKFMLYAPTTAGHDADGCIVNTPLMQLKGTVDTMQTDMDTLKTKTAEMESNLAMATGLVIDASSKVSVLQSQVTVMSDKLVSLGNRMATAEGGVNSLNSQMVTIRSRMTGIETQINELNVAVGKQKVLTDTNTTNITAVTRDLSNTKVTVTEQGVTILTNTQNVANIKTRVQTLETSLASASAYVTQAMADLTALEANVSSTKQKVQDTNALVTSMVNCGKSSKVYNNDTKTCDLATIPDARIRRLREEGTKGARSVSVSCDPGWVVLGCTGSRNPDLTDNCDESSCGLVGTALTNMRTCKVVIEKDDGSKPTVWATCMKL